MDLARRVLTSSRPEGAVMMGAGQRVLGTRRKRGATRTASSRVARYRGTVNGSQASLVDKGGIAECDLPPNTKCRSF